MKTIVKMLLLLLWSVSVNAQARLVKTEEEIRKDFPKTKFTSGTTYDGYKYISMDYPMGIFIYMFDEVGSCNFNMFLIKDLEDANLLAERYNSKYLIIGDGKWKAMTEDNYIMYIQLVYDNEFKAYIFKYTLEI
jgi:hypothetical protein